jgi:hypothetical protein
MVLSVQVGISCSHASIVSVEIQYVEHGGTCSIKTTLIASATTAMLKTWPVDAHSLTLQ